MNCLYTDPQIINSDRKSISTCFAETEAVDSEMSVSAFQMAEDESGRNTLRPFKGLMVAALFSLPFWMILTLMLI